MINCIIIDDDAVSISVITHFISNTEGFNLVESFRDPISAANYLRKNVGGIDLIFLDVEMPEMTGIELLESFNELPPVILITSKEKYAVKAFEHKVAHYLVKPVEYGKFLKAIQQVYKLIESSKTKSLDYIFIKDNGVMYKVLQDDILYCEASGDYVKIYLKYRSYVLISTMKNIEENLKNNINFVRIHRSYIANVKFIDNFGLTVFLSNGKSLPLGNKYRANLQARLIIF